MTFRTSFFPSGSSWDVGSSRTRWLGFIAITDAMASLCFSPPLRFGGNSSSRPLRPTTFRAHSTLPAISSRDRPRFSSANATSSSTVMLNSWLSGFWRTRPTIVESFETGVSVVLKVSPVRGSLTMTSPENCPRIEFGIIPFSVSARVDFPLPLGPRIPMNSPSFIVRLTPLRADLSEWTYLKETSRTSIIFSSPSGAGRQR
ncbi:hypothetical protein TEU_07435 [Thermococcus eurythermalis]|uniref:Uncharacterized protein n=1 Tax=Thermococcus eurythermalis TaxID=1505907 RepID=A0A097QUM0_9EURY|nr:hypothetical protein TEU_07435 [Thermococcus eurythermalis]